MHSGSGFHYWWKPSVWAHPLCSEICSSVFLLLFRNRNTVTLRISWHQLWKTYLKQENCRWTERRYQISPRTQVTNSTLFSLPDIGFPAEVQINEYLPSYYCKVQQRGRFLWFCTLPAPIFFFLRSKWLCLLLLNTQQLLDPDFDATDLVSWPHLLSGPLFPGQFAFSAGNAQWPWTQSPFTPLCLSCFNSKERVTTHSSCCVDLTKSRV